MMKTEYTKFYFEEQGVTCVLSTFCTEYSEVTEQHIMLRVEPRREGFEGQYRRVCEAEARLLGLPAMQGARAVCKRYFLSDPANQQPLMRSDEDCAVSAIGQPPLDGSKVALWVYYQTGTAVTCEDGMAVAEHNGYRHLWTMGMHDGEGDSARQTERLLIDYEAALRDRGATLAENCVRTWFFVRDVDTQYAGLVKARRENFVTEGLTPETHYIASTGIGGAPADTRALIQLGAYALTGMERGQMHYLYALSHLNRTIEYGVTFERGTLMEYGDRVHAYISGTASIDNKGCVVHVGDVVGQTRRMWENVETLLAEGGMAMDDVMQAIVYLRDMADYDVVRRLFEERFPTLPYVITLAPVCRPAWLIEMECIAVAERRDERFRMF